MSSRFQLLFLIVPYLLTSAYYARAEITVPGEKMGPLSNRNHSSMIQLYGHILDKLMINNARFLERISWIDYLVVKMPATDY